MRLSVIVPCHNSHPERFARTLAGLAAQTLPASAWETIVVDNASQPPMERTQLSTAGLPNLRLVLEAAPGLTAARRAGLRGATGEVCVFVDDDNVLTPTYLARALDLFAARPGLGAAGGPSRPEFERPAPPWTEEFFPLLALRDLGPSPLFAKCAQPAGGATMAYPSCAPIGAGMALRRSAMQVWLDRATPGQPSDRRGTELTSGGDNDIVLSLLRDGWEVGYSPDLALTHLIPAARLAPAYLARLNRGIQKSWMQVLAQHEANPWPPIARWTVPLRQTKAWFTHRAWSGAPAHIRWQGACGHFEGRVTSSPASR